MATSGGEGSRYVRQKRGDPPAALRMVLFLGKIKFSAFESIVGWSIRKKPIVAPAKHRTN